jgi:HD-GYP domain-containing protein (c-di-GMP phosphodiesterase class II)
MIVEMVVSASTEYSKTSQYSLGDITKRLLSLSSIEHMCDQAALEVEILSGYDRVMIYQFDADFNGSVIAEAKRNEMESYLGLNYPASDIPSQARELFRKNLVRCIVDVDYHPVGFLRDPSSASLDMTYSYLRSVSPVHIEYLKNMGVQSTMTISILIDGELWGLIACHHRQAHQLSLNSLELVENFGKIFAGLLKTRIEGEEQRRTVQLHSTLEAIAASIQTDQSNQDLIVLLSNHRELFYSLFDADGFAFLIGEDMVTFNHPCTKEVLLNMIGHIQPFMENGSFFTSRLINTLPDFPKKLLTECAGLIVIEVPMNIPSYWLWFRREKAQTLTWGGNPYEKATFNDRGGISPRKSFAAFKETVRYQSDPWQRSEIAFGEHFIPIIAHLYQGFESQKKVIVQQHQIQRMEDEKLLHYKQLLESLVDLIEQRDAYTAGHTRRVAIYCDLIAKAIGLTIDQRSQLYEAAILHDIGKVVVPDAILLKPGRLDHSEYELIKSHLNTGYQMLSRISYYRPLADIIRCHHEKYDGTGYPRGLMGDDIPLTSHIMIVADAIDAMTSNRIYQPRRSMAESIEEIIRYRGIWYHPRVVDAAVLALQTLDGDDIASQIPITPIERARFSYYFKDQLTGVYNESYLHMIIHSLVPDVIYRHYLLVEIKGMSEYNTNHGWHAGSTFIHAISERLQSTIPVDRIFRVFGDDFIIGSHSSDENVIYKQTLHQCMQGVNSIIRELAIDDLIQMLEE